MDSLSEIGHNINIDSYSAAYEVLEEMGSLHNPRNADVTLEGLALIKTILADQKCNIDTATIAYRADLETKEGALNQMEKKVAKINTYFKSLDVSESEKENISDHIKVIYGDCGINKAVSNPERRNNNAISNTLQGFENQAENFNFLIAKLAKLPAFEPSENDIKIETLLIDTRQLASINVRVKTSGAALITARAARNNTLYFNNPNVIDLIKYIKAYLRSLGDVAKPYYDALVSLKFLNMTTIVSSL